MPVDLMLLLPPYFQAVYEYQVLMDIEGFWGLCGSGAQRWSIGGG